VAPAPVRVLIFSKGVYSIRTGQASPMVGMALS
jgi:hypothetical protein